MRKIEFDMVNGIMEVKEFSGEDYKGSFTRIDVPVLDDFFNEHFTSTFEGTLSMEVDEYIFNAINEVYGIDKLK